MDIKLSQMTLEDLNHINIDDFDDFWTLNILREEIESDSSYFVVAKSENEIIGFAGIKFILDEVHITNIVTRVDKRNLGVASKLLDFLIKKVQLSYSLITLEVNVANTVAIHLYEKYKFIIVRT